MSFWGGLVSRKAGIRRSDQKSMIGSGLYRPVESLGPPLPHFEGGTIGILAVAVSVIVDSGPVAGSGVLKMINNGLDKKAREKMSYASLLGGVCVANASTCLPHRLQQAMGGVIDVSHGKGLSTLYKSWIKIAYPFKKKKFDISGYNGTIALLHLDCDLYDSYKCTLEHFYDMVVSLT